MNTNLLKLARRYRGGLYWTLPGYDNGAKLIPASRTMKGWGASLSWPARDAKGDVVRSVDLNRHRKLAKQEMRRLIANFA